MLEFTVCVLSSCPLSVWPRSLKDDAKPCIGFSHFVCLFFAMFFLPCCTEVSVATKLKPLKTSSLRCYEILTYCTCLNRYGYVSGRGSGWTRWQLCHIIAFSFLMIMRHIVFDLIFKNNLDYAAMRAQRQNWQHHKKQVNVLLFQRPHCAHCAFFCFELGEHIGGNLSLPQTNSFTWLLWFFPEGWARALLQQISVISTTSAETLVFLAIVDLPLIPILQCYPSTLFLPYSFIFFRRELSAVYIYFYLYLHSSIVRLPVEKVFVCW